MNAATCIRMIQRSLLPALCGFVLATTGLIPCMHAADREPVFERDIQPVLAEKCGTCHSAQVQKGGLNLATMAGVLAGGESQEALVSNSIDDSLLWTMVEAGDMPPEGQPRLSKKDVELLRRWIAAGALRETPDDSQAPALNQHDVLPIFLMRCTACHGARVQQAGLDLRDPSSMLKGGKSGPAIIAGDADASLVMKRIESEACPPRELLLAFFVKRPPNSEIEILRKWIAAGAPEVDVAPDIATTEPDPLVSDEDRQHWAFQAPQRSVEQANQTLRSIDDFVAAKLAQNGLEFSPQADCDTLIRRAHVDLIGMPPSLEEWQHWRGESEASSSSSDWYRRMIDHLLASPHYGERWGRYWLDVAGYADSEGGISADPVRDVAWKYRDYVIRAFNEDTPYDRFLLEQLAGDELLDHARASEITEEMVNNLIATGFLRMGIDETGSRTMNFVPERLNVINDAIAVVSSGLMGLTMECARCHSHKYDAIPHRDYYRLKAIFQGALDEHDWSSFKTRSLKVATQKHRQLVAKTNPPLEAEVKALESKIKKAVAENRVALLRHHYPEQSEAENQETLQAIQEADNQRTLPQKILFERLQVVELLPDAEQPDSVLEGRRRMAQLESQKELLRRKMEPSIEIRALWDLGRPSPTYILRRGEPTLPGKLVGPGVPSVLTDGRTPFEVQPPFPEGTPKTGRRLAFARWLTQPDHPLTARVMVNRIWYHHFGVGIVRDLENFGIKGERPSHPELLDWLALEFINQGWSIKEMHRLIMNSRSYRQSSGIAQGLHDLDPQNRLLSHMPLRRLDAEALRDSLLLVSGRLDVRAGGLPDSVSVDRDGLVSVNPNENGNWRRSVYLQYRRTEIPTIMDTFDYPQMGPNCLARNISNVSPQSLMLMNNGHIRELAASLAKRVEQVATVDSFVGHSHAELLGSCVDAAYAVALNRLPSEEEQRLGIENLKELESAWRVESGGTAPSRALESYCHVLLNSAAFLYVD